MIQKGMKYVFLLSGILFSLSVGAQKYSGQWRGSFEAKGDTSKTEYVLEFDVNGTTIEGTSTTYFMLGGKRYYTICAIKGTFDPASKTFVSTETSRIKANTPAWFGDCLQTHILTYFKKGNTEQLVGTWKPASKENNCGTGSTVLSRTLLVKNPIVTPPPSTTVRVSPPANKPAVTTQQKQETVAKNKPAPVKQAPKKDTVVKTAPVISKVENKIQPQSNPETKPVITAPKLPNGIEKRDNKVFETISLSSDEIIVNLYDNAEIDGDVITVLFNGEVIASKQTLSDKPITLKLKAIHGKDNTLTMYAENMGRVPPNTAIMKVQSGDDYFKVFLSADDQKNASVVFRVK